jgi:hypothetical protein
MSLAIDVDIIEKVLLSDGWHEVADVPSGGTPMSMSTEGGRCCPLAKWKV